MSRAALPRSPFSTPIPSMSKRAAHVGRAKAESNRPAGARDRKKDFIGDPPLQCITSWPKPWSHPVKAEARLGDGRVHRRLDAEGKDPAGVDRVDDPVVPKSGGGEVGGALLLVLLEGRRL